MTDSTARRRELVSDPLAFWEQRHASLDAWRAGGDRGLSEQENYEFYIYRLGQLVRLLRKYAGLERRLRVLDAGCGRGHVTDALRRCGHSVTGIDASSTAIDWARKHYGHGFVQCSLDVLAPPRLFDVIIGLDVLFHILDDAEWRGAIEAFGRYASAEAILVLTDTFADRRYQLGDYIVHRTTAEYDQALTTLGFQRCELVPYDFGSNNNCFAVYRRSI